MAWQKLSINEAEAHPLYGVKGPLRVFLILFVLGGLFGLLQLFLPDPRGFAQLFGPFDRQVHYVDSFVGLVLAVVAVLGLNRSPLFGSLIVPALLLRYFATILIASVFHFEAPEAPSMTADLMTQSILVAIGVGGIVCALLCWYFLRSRRVNVTYRYRIPADPKVLAQANPDPWARFR
ncbi:hypothetical protein [Amorphus orientalis]|uniref:Drug/metabolite transporter (DMT)-like permease n=1 Tax=Amorphus orientalis TaxID=649198 RepID=A0AAE4ASX3_9HYPH|nr:hypothetical protein [Amorphus orientalis]MDQ0315567.1 drug/metabolite transporter (DMT)-like permease [Amorphus orientalis]